MRYEIAEVLLDDVAGARAVLRPARGRCQDQAKSAGPASIEVPLGAVEATMLSLLLHKLPAGDRPSWHALYTATLSVGGVAVERVELDAIAGRLVGAILLAQPGRATGRRSSRVAAPVEAALMVSLETRAPLWVTAAAIEARSTGTSDHQPAGHALLATLLASLPDEDFGSIH
jgi:hypothetical protein